MNWLYEEFWSYVGIVPTYAVKDTDVAKKSRESSDPKFIYAIARQNNQLAYFISNEELDLLLLQPLMNALKATISMHKKTALQDIPSYTFGDKATDQFPQLKRCLQEPQLKKQLWQALLPIRKA